MNLRDSGSFGEVGASLRRKRVFDLVEGPEVSLEPRETLLDSALLDQVGTSLSGMVELPLLDKSIEFES